MNIARKIHDQFRVKGDQKGAIASAISQAGAATITQVVIAGAGGSTGNNNGGLNDEERQKFDSIEYGAQKNQDAFSNLDLNAVNFDVDGQQVSTSSVSISANTPTDKANVKIIGLDPLVVTLESEPLFNSTQVECTGLYNSIYKIEYIDNNSKVKLTYVSGDQFLSADIDVIKVTHDDTVLAEYSIGEYSYTVAGEAITSFTIPYSTPNFAQIRFYKYQQEDTELENGSIVTNEVLQLLATIEASPTTQSVIKLSNPYQELWHYLEDEDGNQFLWTDCNVFSTKEVSAYGKRTGSGAGSGAGYLYELGDVSADAKDPANNSILQYNSTTKKWEVTDGSNIKTDLSSYATIAYTKQYVGDQIKILKGDAPTTLDTLEELAAAIGNDPNFGTTVTTNIDTLTDKVSDLNTKVEQFLSWFVWDDANGAIKALHNLYGVSEIAAYGYGKEEEITIRTQLGDLSDVSIRDAQDGNILMYNSESGRWINVSKTSVGLNETELANYLVTNGYKNSANSLTIEVNYVPVGTYNPFSEAKRINITVPTKVSDLDNDALVSNTRKVTAGTGLAGGGTLNEDIELRLATFGTAGDYYKVTVDEYGRVSTGKTTLDIADITNLQSSLDSKLDISEIEKWFTIIYDTNGDITSIQANYTFYSVGEISAYGLGDIGSTTRTTLASMDDVDISDSLAKDDMLVYNGTKWVNVQMSQVQGVSTWDDLLGKPTTISGFGITDAYTKTEVDNKVNTINSSISSINSSISTITSDVSTLSTSLSAVSTKLDTFLEGSDTDDIINKWKELEAFLAGYTQTQTLAELLEVKANSSVKISAGTGLTGGGDLTANRTISLATSGVTAGTYTKVTVDTYGRVTSGDTLLDTDIPNLDWSKITTGKPTTLAGYGITDGVNSITVTGDGNAITTVSISNHLLTFTKGETFLPQSTFDDLFEKVNVGTSDSPVYVIKAKYNLYSVGEVAAYGFGDTGTVKGTLASLEDVNINTPTKGQALVYDGTNWTNSTISGGSIGGALTIQTNGSTLATYDGSVATTVNIAIPTKLSELTDDLVSGKYLPLSGGTLTGILTAYDRIEFNNGDKDRKTIIYNTGTFATISPTSGGWAFGHSINKSDGSLIGYSSGALGQTANTLLYYYYGGNYDSPKMVILPNGYVGIGTTSPSYTLHVNGSAYATTISAGANNYADSYSGALNMNNSNIYGVNSILFEDLCKSASEGIQFYNSSSTVDSLWAKSGVLYFTPNRAFGSTGTNYTILHSGNSDFYYSAVRTTGTNIDSINTQYPRTYEIYNATGTLPFTANWHHIYIMGSYDPAYGMQLATPYVADGSLYIRHKVGGVWKDWRTILDTINYSSYALPLSGGTLTGTDNILSLNSTSSSSWIYYKLNGTNKAASGYYGGLAFVSNETTYARIGVDDSGIPRYQSNTNSSTRQTLLHSGNYNGYSPSLTGLGASGTWGISISGNAATATALQTVRTIWGQSFNGTGNVNGTLSINGTAGSYTEGIRIHPSSTGWTTFMLCGTDNTSSSGTSTNSWSMHAYSGNFYINRNASNDTTNYILCNVSSNWGIGTSSPSNKLHVYAGTAGDVLRLEANQSWACIVYKHQGSYSWSVGANTNNWFYFWNGYLKSHSAYIDIYGNFAAVGEITAYSSSDIRLKTNLNKLNSLSIIRKLGVYSFDWNEEALQLRVNKNIHDYGLIAQQVQQYIPEVINTNMFNKGYLGIDYQRLVPFTISAIKEVDDEVTKLKKRVKQLERKLQKYESTEVFYTKGND